MNAQEFNEAPTTREELDQSLDLILEDSHFSRSYFQTARKCVLVDSLGASGVTGAYRESTTPMVALLIGRQCQRPQRKKEKLTHAK